MLGHDWAAFAGQAVGLGCFFVIAHPVIPHPEIACPVPATGRLS